MLGLCSTLILKSFLLGSDNPVLQILDEIGFHSFVD